MRFYPIKKCPSLSPLARVLLLLPVSVIPLNAAIPIANKDVIHRVWSGLKSAGQKLATGV